MLLDPKADQPLQQGDIIQDVPFVILPKVLNIKANNVQGQAKLTCQDHTSIDQVKAFSQGNTLAVSQLPLSFQSGMIVTQGCDIDYGDSIMLARVFSLSQLIWDVKEAIDHNEPLVVYDVIRRLTEGHEHPHLVYLGSPDGKVRYAADLSRVQSFPRDWKDFFLKKRWKTLTPHGLSYVQARMSFHVGRLATEQGFWHSMTEDVESAKAAQEPAALDQAKSRLEEKRGRKK